MRLPSQLLRRKPNTHKGDFGHVFVLAGSARYSGSGVLSSAAALSSGAGLVTLGVPKSLNNAIIKIKPKEVMTLPLPETKEGTFAFSAYKKIESFSRNIDVLAIGPGLTQHKQTQRLARKVILGAQKQIVIDADGLNALVGHLDLLRRNKKYPIRPPQNVGGRPPMQCGGRNTIITPHPGEMARLLETTIQDIQKKREVLAKKFANKYLVTVVLKGHNSVVADFRGNFYINKSGNPGMATAGSGDVLVGIIASFLGQGLDAFSAAKYAVYLHGVAGDLAEKEKTQLGLIASDIIEKIPAAIKLCF